MPHNKAFTRREALKAAALGALALPLAGVTGRAAGPVAPARPSPRFSLGLASFTFAKLSIEEFIPVLRRLELSTVSLYKTHAPWPDGTPAQCRTAVQKFADAGITVTSTGMIEVMNDEATARRALENVRGAGLKMFCAHTTAAALPLLDRLVKEFDLKAAIHNHGPSEDLPTGMAVWQAIQPFDRRLGLCLDIAHGFRAGEDPAATVRAAHSRLYEVHLRDTAAPGGAMKDPSPTVVGRGAVDVRGVLAALLEVGYVGQAEFEYEKKEDDRIPGLAESVGYVRGLLTALTV
jgi:inosose dehydratase